MSIKDIAVRRSDMFHVAPDQIEVQPGFNVRWKGPELDAHIRVLADSIKEIGVQTPIKVRVDGDKVFLVDGHCRMDAIKLAIKEGAEIASVPCMVEQRGTDEASRTLALLTSNAGKQLEAIEKAEVFKRLLAFGWTETQIGQKSGIGEKQVRNLLDLASAPSEVKAMVAAKEVSPTLATKVVQKEGPTQAVQTLKAAVTQAKSEGKTKVTPKAIARPDAPTAPLPKQPAPPPPSPTPRYSAAKVQEFVEVLNECLKLSDVKIIHTMIRDTLK